MALIFTRNPKTENRRFKIPCTICQHPQHQEIDQALVAGSATLAALSQQYNLSTSALHRHKAHLRAKVGRAKSKLMDYLQQNCIFWLSQNLEMILRTAQTAEAEGNGKLVLQAASQGARLVNMIMKHDLPLDDRLVYKIITSPQWATQASLWPDDPEIMASQRQFLAETFAIPCPETAPPPLSSDSLGDLDTDMLQALLPALDQSILRTENRKLKTANRAFQKREKSGKLPGKTGGEKIKSQENQKHIFNEKIFAKNADCPCTNDRQGDLAADRLDIATLNAIGAGQPLPNIFPEFLAAAALEAPGGVVV